ncbi:MAG: hypothetical protein R3249_05715 [Nitriliruptorales bacterium]|nr:hypothetical protein [Nitriliruptorales bacterium]
MGNDEDLAPADAALLSAIGAGPGLTLAEAAREAALPEPVLEALAREGVLVPGPGGYQEADIEAARAGAVLLEAGLPLGDLLALARRFDEAMRPVAESAVDAFLTFVRDPAHGATESEQEAAARMLEAFNRMLPATSTIVGHRVRQLLIAAGLQRAAERT